MLFAETEKHLLQCGASVRNLDEAIISVPHSGTRSLCQHLFEGYEMYPYLHFGNQTLDEFRGVAHIPVRHPVDIAVSWQARDRHDVADLLKRLREMVSFALNYRHVELYAIEDIRQWERSVGPDDPIRRMRSSAMIDAVRAWFEENARFYGLFYPMK